MQKFSLVDQNTNVEPKLNDSYIVLILNPPFECNQEDQIFISVNKMLSA